MTTRFIVTAYIRRPAQAKTCTFDTQETIPWAQNVEYRCNRLILLPRVMGDARWLPFREPYDLIRRVRILHVPDFGNPSSP